MSMDVILMIGYESGDWDREYNLVKSEKMTEKDHDSILFTKEENGNQYYGVATGNYSKYFIIQATAELHRLSRNSLLNKLDYTHNDESHFWRWPNCFKGEYESRDKDNFMLKPVPLSEVLTILKEDDETKDTYGGKYAVALLESMQNGFHDFSVLIYVCGY